MPYLQTSYTNYPDYGLEGGLVDAFPHQIQTVSNKTGASAQSYSVAVGTAANSTVYSLNIIAERRGVFETISITSAAAATVASILAQLEAAFNANVILRSQYSAAVVATNLVVTARTPGLDSGFILTVSGGGVGYTATLSAVAADPTTIPFGRFISYDPTVIATNSTRQNGFGSSAYVLPTKLPANANDINVNLAGLLVRTNAYQPSLETGYYSAEGLLPYSAGNVCTQGRVYIRPVTDILLGDPLHIYVSGVNRGRVRRDADGALTQQYTAGRIRIIGRAQAGQITVASIL